MAECVGCGFCCSKAPCAIGMYEMEERGRLESWRKSRRCSFLIFQAGRHWCQLVLDEPAKYGPRLYVGDGCCSSLNSDRRRYVRSK